jgi:pyridoxal phosphate enzyme (YggS family)
MTTQEQVTRGGDTPDDRAGVAPSDHDTVTAALASVRREIREAAEAAGRAAGTVTLVAVSKTQPVARLEAALAAGQRVFGENRVQEAAAKWPALRSRHPDLELHLIGPLQTNKVREAVALFDVIETLDRPKLAAALAAEMALSGRRPRCYLEVNTGEEVQKAGVNPADLEALLTTCRDQYRLPVTGLMAIPPQNEDPALHFALLADLARRHGLPEISMGMSSDFPLAVRFGATHVRIGTALFGVRPTPEC